MNIRIKTLAIVSTVLAGAITASGQPQERRQRQQQPELRLRAERTCPACGAPRLSQQRRFQGRRYGVSQQKPNRGRQYRRQGAIAQNPQAPPRQRRSGAPQFQGRNRQQQGSPQFTPQQRQRIQQQKQVQQRKPLFKRFDGDGDGRLSEQEWQSLKREIQKRSRAPQTDESSSKKRNQSKKKHQKGPAPSE